MEDFKEVWELSRSGNLPVRSEDSRRINHKCKALNRLVDRYDAFLKHVTTLAENQSIKSTNRVHLKEHLKQWKQSKVPIGAAVYVDVLKALPSLA